MRSKNNEYFDLIEGFVDDYMDSHGISPSTREIATGTGLSTATVSRYMSYMREHGMIDYVGQRNIITKRKRISATASISVPLLGAVSCGIPKFAEGNIEEYVQLPATLFGKGNFFLLRANGDSMTEAGIDHGDLVLVRCQDHAKPGQIVVALIGDDEATLKRFFPEPSKGVIRLHPENSKFDDIVVKACVIQGIAVHVLKDLQ